MPEINLDLMLPLVAVTRAQSRNAGRDVSLVSGLVKNLEAR